eukprot:scaffold184_cov379-Prasinococcus_capsulatus_cf.AAC.17
MGPARAASLPAMHAAKQSDDDGDDDNAKAHAHTHENEYGMRHSVHVDSRSRYMPTQGTFCEAGGEDRTDRGLGLASESPNRAPPWTIAGIVLKASNALVKPKFLRAVRG